MKRPAEPAHEEARLAVLEALDVMGGPPVAELDCITRTAARLFRVPMALISLVDRHRQWFTSRIGLDLCETPRDVSFCAHAIADDGPLVVPDARADLRFHDNPLVSHPPSVRFYAGVPIRSREGHALGTLCLLDTEPRDFGSEDLAALDDLARLAERYFQSRESEVRVENDVLREDVARLQAEIDRRTRLERQLEAQRNRFRDVLRDSADAFVEIDGEDRIVDCNEAAGNIFGWPSEHSLGAVFSDLAVPEAARADHRRWLRRLVDSGLNVRLKDRVERVFQRFDGTPFPAEVTFSTSAGEALHVYAFIHDISRRKADERALRQGAAQLRTITDNVPALIAELGTDLRYRFHNRYYHQYFDLPKGGLVGQAAPDFWGAKTYEHLRPYLDKVLSGQDTTLEYRLQARQGPMWFHASLVPRLDEGRSVIGFYLLAQDITERRQLHEQIAHQALHDALTGLPNRRSLMQRLDEAMARAQRQRNAVAVLFMDLDGFKQFNDQHGHAFGDTVLKHFSEILSSAVRETDQVARLSGDEFVVVLEALEPVTEAAERVALALLKRIGIVRQIQGVDITLSSSVGIALHTYLEHETASALLSRADAAMYRAKQLGANQHAF